MQAAARRIGLIAGLAWGNAQLLAAQQAPVGATPVPNQSLSFDQTLGFGKAELTTTEGEKHLLYVPLSMSGFGELLPFFRREEEIGGLTPPLFISVDKVQSVYVPTTGLYLEHMVVKGRRQHVLGVRVLDGPVELFSYIPNRDATTGPPGFQTSPVVYSRRQWYLRRQGELTAVAHGGFVKQMSAYFQDDAVVVDALAGKTMGYDELKTLVRIYNDHRAVAAPAR